ncbi:MAG: phosphatidate cytidylyltransferase, partial [Acidimicrobiia bacterium]|nr:phosphatidate cytidylyltransferase [Acidimicrobiia bacterium]
LSAPDTLLDLTEPPAAHEPDPDVSVVARAFEERLSEPHVGPGPEAQEASAPVATVVTDPDPEPELQIDLRQPESEPALEPTLDAKPEVVLAKAPEPAPVADAKVLAQQLEARQALAVVRAREHQAELRLVHKLATAEATAHEESAMWSAVAGAREAIEGGSRSSTAAVLQRAPVDESWAEEAIAMEESRQRLEETRRRTEAEVQTVLDRALATKPQTVTEDESSIAERFAAIAAQLRREDSAETNRQHRAEDLRLRTSLLVLDAEAPWRESGWSRPGSSFAAMTQSPNGPGTVNLMPIATTNPSTVAESAERRRWPWSRKRITASVTVIEERPVSEKDELGDEGQSALPFDESSVDTPFDLDADETDGWDNWAIDDQPNDPLAELDVEGDGPSGASTRDQASDASDSGEDDEKNWEEFTAGEYVQTATQEYADLAAAVAAAEQSEAPEQAAITADMPGLESSLVGLEDVVEAEGLEAAEAAPRSDLALRVVTALALVALFFASLTYSWAIAVLVVVVMVMAAGELATVLLRQRYHPVSLFAYIGTLGLLLGTWQYGLVTIPFVVAATLVVVLLYFGLVAGREDPLTSMTLTLLSVLWVGVLASFAMDMVNAAEFRWLIGSLVVVVAVMDMAQYFVGKRFGKRLLAPVVSPKKTVAGLVGGVIAAASTGFALSFVAPFDQVTGVILGSALAVTGPIGDLAVSVLKRTLGVKDMGTILPGHGGILDRIDAILFSLPAAWLVYAWASLLV